jgi:hypothetical protein
MKIETDVEKGKDIEKGRNRKGCFIRIEETKTERERERERERAQYVPLSAASAPQQW